MNPNIEKSFNLPWKQLFRILNRNNNFLQPMLLMSASVSSWEEFLFVTLMQSLAAVAMIWLSPKHIRSSILVLFEINGSTSFEFNIVEERLTQKTWDSFDTLNCSCLECSYTSCYQHLPVLETATVLNSFWYENCVF